jgi:hypothetical protein
MATLEELQPKVGQVVQLQLVHLEQPRVYAKLIGYVAEQAMVVTVPAVGDRIWPIRDGDGVVCRAFTDGVAFGFQTQALRVTQQPFPHVFLAYPQHVESVVVRKTSRVPLQREAVLLKSTEQGELREPAMLADLSVRGSCALSKPGLAAVNEPLTLLVPAVKPDEMELRLSVIVRSARVSDAGAGKQVLCHYGVEFVDPGADQVRMVEKLMSESGARAHSAVGPTA